MASVVTAIAPANKEAVLSKIISEKIATCSAQEFIDFLSSEEIIQIAAGLNPKSMALILLGKFLLVLDFADKTSDNDFYVASINALLKSPDIDLTFTTQNWQNAVVLFIEAAYDDTEHKLTLLNNLLTQLQEKAEACLLKPLYTPVNYTHLPTDFNALSLALCYKNKALMEVLSRYVTGEHGKQLLERLLEDDDNYNWAISIALQQNWLNAQDKGTYLIDASVRGRIATVEALLDSGADINYISGSELLDINQETPLMVAARFGHLNLVQLLIARGANIGAIYQHEKGHGSIYVTALTLACQYGHTEIVELLANNGALSASNDIKTNIALERAFTKAASNGHTNIVRFLLAQRDYSAVLNEALLYAVSKDHRETVVFLLDKIASLNNPPVSTLETTPLVIATINGQEDMINLLLDRGATLERTDFDGDTALTRAAFYGLTSIVRLLLDRGANIAHTNRDGLNSLVLAASNGHYSVVELLIIRGNYTLANNIESIEKALAAATRYNKLNIVRYLVNLYNYDNLNKLLSIAAFHYRINIMEFLLAKGADINKALDAAIAASKKLSIFGRYQIVDKDDEKLAINQFQWLIDNGAQFSSAQYSIAFWLAAQKRQVKLMQFLIDKGVDFNYICHNNKTLLENSLNSVTKWKHPSRKHLAMVDTLRDLQVRQRAPNIVANNVIAVQPPRSFLPSISSIASVGQKAANLLRSLCRR